MVLTTEIKSKLNELKKLRIEDIIEVPYSYLEHINSEYESGSYGEPSIYICNKQKEILEKVKSKIAYKNDLAVLSKNDWIYFLYSQNYDD